MNGSPDAAALLAQLAGLATPPAIRWWPPAWGWWAVCALLLFAVVWCARAYREARVQRQWRREALAELDLIERALAGGDSRLSLLTRVSVLLRRVAILQLGRAAVARAHGTAWLDTLDRLSGSTAFSHGAGRCLLAHPFRADEPAEADVRDVLALARALVTRLRRRPVVTRPPPRRGVVNRG